MNQVTFTSLQEAHGEIPYNMTNDYMFRAVLQKNNKVLRGLIGSLLHLSEAEMLSVTITNPIIIGEALIDKEFRLDINVELNNRKNINLEMQVVDLHNWVNRSLSYLCRSFDQLNHGESYKSIKTVIHIGILDYTLFKDNPEFYAAYRMMNVKNHTIYSNNFILNVLDLTQIDLATEEDKQFQIDYWAKLFKSNTWEELKTVAAQNEYLQEASETIFTLSSDDLVRKRCLDREAYYIDMKAMQEDIKAMQEDIEEEKEKNVKLQEEIAQKDSQIAEKDFQIAEKETTIAQQAAENAALRKQLEEYQKHNNNVK